MEIILKADVEKVGHAGDIVTVKDGYGRNYLIPKGVAILATPSAKKVHAENLKQRAHKLEKIKNEALELAAKMEGKSITIGAKTSSTGKIFGSVNTIQLAEQLAKLGFDMIDRKQINLQEDSIKEIGQYTAKIKLHKEVVVDFPFQVVSE
jgi:large subunit ribosomal protein L9